MIYFSFFFYWHYAAAEKINSPKPVTRKRKKKAFADVDDDDDNGALDNDSDEDFIPSQDEDDDIDNYKDDFIESPSKDNLRSNGCKNSKPLKGKTQKKTSKRKQDKDKIIDDGNFESFRERLRFNYFCHDKKNYFNFHHFTIIFVIFRSVIHNGRRKINFVICYFSFQKISFKEEVERAD